MALYFYQLFFVFTLSSTAIAGETYISVSTGSPLFAYKLLDKAAQGLPIGQVTDNVSVLAGKSLRYGVTFTSASAGSEGWVSDISFGLFNYKLIKSNGIGTLLRNTLPTA